MLLHGFEQRGLCLGRRTVDFVSQDHVGKDRTMHKLHAAPAIGILLEYLRTSDIRRHQVGRELNALKLQMEYLRHAAHQQRLGQPGAPVIKQ